jgi:hypothetical protein
MLRLMLFCVLAFVASCQTLSPRPELEPEVALGASDPRPRAFIGRLTIAAAQRTSLRGALRMSLISPDLNFRRPQRLAVRRSGDMRIEVMGLFGLVAGVLVTDGDRYQRYEALTGSFTSGDITPDLLWRVARMALEPAEATSLLLGVPAPSHGTHLVGAYGNASGQVLIYFRDAAETFQEKFVFDEVGSLVAMSRSRKGGHVVWDARFGDYREVAGEPFAFEVQLHFPEVGAKADLNFDNVRFNDELADGLFVLRNPNGAGS